MNKRPKLIPPTLEEDAAIMEALKRSGPGWQARVNSLLRDALELRRNSV